MLTCWIGFPLPGQLPVVKYLDVVSPGLPSFFLLYTTLAKTSSSREIFFFFLPYKILPLMPSAYPSCYCLREFSKSFWCLFLESKMFTVTFSGLYHWSFTYTSNLMSPLLNDHLRPLCWRFQLAAMSFPFPGHSSGAFVIILQNLHVSSHLLSGSFYDHPYFPDNSFSLCIIFITYSTFCYFYVTSY